MNDKPKLLIIDDDETLCTSLADILELEGYLVDTSYNAEDGIKNVESGFYNIVLLDMRLPDSDGIEVLRKIKKISPDTEVIIFTAYAEMDIVIKAMDRNAFSFLPKPYEIPYLITTLKRAREKQRTIFENYILYQQTVIEEKRWAETFDAISDMISILDENLCVIKCNKALLQGLGVELKDIQGKKSYKVYFGIEEPSDSCICVKCKKTQKAVSEEVDNLLIDGTFLMSCYPRFDEAGKFNGIVHLTRDITERKEAEQALLESEEQFRSTFEHAGVGIVHVTPNGQFLRMNKLFCDILGHSEDEMFKLTFQDITHSDELEIDTNLASQLLDGKIKTYAMEKRYLKKDGKIVWVNLTVSLVRKPDGEPKYFICVVVDITERKQIEDALRKSEEKFRAIFDNTFQFIGLLKPNGAVIESNRGALDFAGIKLSDVFNKPLWETPWWSHSETLQKLLQKSINEAAKGNFIRFEAEHFKHDGTLAYIDTSLTPVKDKNGKVIFIIPEGRDITELKQIEEKVHMLSQAVEQSPASVIITDKGGNIEYVNQKFSEISGYDYGEVIGKNPRILRLGEKSPEENRELWKTITSGYEWRGEFHNKKKNGDLYWEYASISPIRNQEGDITHFLAVNEDITERKHIEQALLESEEKFRTISTTANDAIIMADNDGNISYWNVAAEKMFGYSSKEATGKAIYEACIPDRFHEAHLRGFKEFKNSGQGAVVGRTTELTAVNSEGTEFPIEFSLSAVKIKDKWNAVAIIRDVTERKKIEEKLRISYKMASLGRLTAGVFHEILNPVNIISSHIQLLLMEAEKGSKTEEDLKSIQEEIARIVKITDSLLRFSRKGAPGTEKIEINDLLEKMISLIEPDMKLDNIRFVRKFDDKLLQISGSKDELRQVFLNLTSNAKDAMPDGGTITVSTKNVTGGEVPFVIIRITDTGCGIDKDKIEFVFEPFFTTKAEGKGTGLGLSTSYGIIEDHGGVLSVESQVGKGSTFTINLPITEIIHE